MRHDREVTAMFEARGWTVLRIWECELKKKNEQALLTKIYILTQAGSDNLHEQI